jgi:hypothetical protein
MPWQVARYQSDSHTPAHQFKAVPLPTDHTHKASLSLSPAALRLLDISIPKLVMARSHPSPHRSLPMATKLRIRDTNHREVKGLLLASPASPKVWPVCRWASLSSSSLRWGNQADPLSSTSCILRIS